MAKIEKNETSKKTYKVKRRITVPLSKLNTNEPMAVKFLGEAARRVQIDAKPDKDGKLKEPATVLRCMNLDTGELVDLIAPMVLLSQLDREYGGHEDQITGVALMIESTGKRAGKNYNDIGISELEAD